jgi:hypothetical protein
MTEWIGARVDTVGGRKERRKKGKKERRKEGKKEQRRN